MRRLGVLAGAESFTDIARFGGKRLALPIPAFAACQRLVLARVKVNAKSSGIVAIPALFDLLATGGAAVTIDAIGSRRRSVPDRFGTAGAILPKRLVPGPIGDRCQESRLPPGNISRCTLR